MLTTTQLSRAEEFLSLAYPLLVQNEATNSLLLGRTIYLSKAPHDDLLSKYFVVQKGKEVVLAAIQTVPYNLILSTSIEEEAPLHLLHFLEAKKLRFPGVIGPRTICLPFAEAYSKEHAISFDIQMQQLVYRLDQITPATRSSLGLLRLAQIEDLPVLAEWVMLFSEESMGEKPDLEKAKIAAERKVDRNELYVWEVDGQVVSMAGIARPTYHGITINFTTYSIC